VEFFFGVHGDLSPHAMTVLFGGPGKEARWSMLREQEFQKLGNLYDFAKEDVKRYEGRCTAS
jgi:hypothetical protein